jgi:hypothetical protein
MQIGVLAAQRLAVRANTEMLRAADESAGSLIDVLG